jgi:hypothetical protein
MKWFLIFMIVICGCSPGNDKTAPKKVIDSGTTVFDTVIPPSQKIIPTDYPAMIRYVTAKLSRIRGFGKKAEDTLINEYQGHIIYETGHIFSREKVHAVVNVRDGDESPVYVFKKEGDRWMLIHSLNEIYHPLEDPIVFRDINFDGHKDLLILWYYSAGRCNCSGDGCMNVYLYNPVTHTLVENHEIPGYLDVVIREQEKAIYLGEHCEGYYKKFRWNKMELVPEESYTRSPSECWEKENTPCSYVHRVHRNGIIIEDTLHTDELPAKWRRVFH